MADHETDKPDEEFNPGGYAKLFSQILDSSIWEEPVITRVVWVTMLAMADKDGKVKSSTSGVIRRANVPKAEGLEAIKTLEAPDLDSKSQEWGGRRIEKIDGGWQILNYRKYRDYRSPKQIAGAKRQQDFRERHRTDTRYVTGRDAPEATASASTEKGRVGPRADTGPASLLLAEIRGLAESNGTHRYIRRDRVVELGQHVARAFDAVGGTERILGATGKEHSFLARDFAAALAAAQKAS